MWICRDCGSRFEKFLVKHETRQSWDGSYDDEILCPFCDSEEIEPYKEEQKS